MPYKVFERSVTRVETPMISVLPDGRITLNAAASRLFQAEQIKAVKILWDEAKRGIALQAAGKDDPNSYSIFFNRGRSATFSPKAFLNYIGWSSKKRQTIPAKWDPAQKMIEAELPARFVGSGKESEKP